MSSLIENIRQLLQLLNQTDEHALSLQQIMINLLWSESKARSIIRTLIETRPREFIRWRGGIKFVGRDLGVDQK